MSVKGHYMIKFVSDWRYLWLSLVPPTNKTDRHDIIEILLKVALNTINQTKPFVKGQSNGKELITQTHDNQLNHNHIFKVRIHF